MREYRLFLESQGLEVEAVKKAGSGRGEGEAEDDDVGGDPKAGGPSMYRDDDRDVDDDRDDREDNDTRATTAQRCLSDGNVAIHLADLFDTTKQVGCSKCRYKGCKKCRGYTLAELRAYEKGLGRHGLDSEDDVVSPVACRKRTRAASCDDALFGADGDESEEDTFASSKKTRWGIGALSGLKAKVLSVVSKPLEALSSLSFWGRAEGDEDGEEEEEEEESVLLSDGPTSVDDGEEEEEEEEVGGVDIGGRKARSVRMAPKEQLPFPHLLARPNRVAPPRTKVVQPQQPLPFPHLLARPNRIAPPRPRAVVSDKENVEPVDMELDVDGVQIAKKKTRNVKVVKSAGKKTSAKASTARTPKSKLRVLCAAGTPSTATKTPARATRTASKAGAGLTASAAKPRDNVGDDNVRKTRLSTLKSSKKPSGRKSHTAAKSAKTSSGTPKGASADPATRVVETPPVDIEDVEGHVGDVSQQLTEDFRDTMAPGVALLERLVDEFTPPPAGTGADMAQQDAGVGTIAGAALDVSCADIVGRTDPVHQANGVDDMDAEGGKDRRDRAAPRADDHDDEQHSTPTPEASFSFADMAGASKDTISAEQLQQFSQEEQGPHHSSGTGLGPLRLAGATDSDADFAFAEALQAFNSPEHGHHAVTRAMDVVGNLMSDLDVSPDGKVGPGRPAKTPGKRRGGSAAGWSPSFDLVDPNASSPPMSPVSFVLPDDDAEKTPGKQRAGKGKGKGNRGNKSSKNSSKNDGDKATEAHHISSLAAEQGSFESAKHLLKKKMVLKQASQDALYMKVREVVINRHLAEIHRQGHDWARLDACGVPLNTSADHEAIEAKVLGSVRKEYGDDSLQKLIAQVEEEWKRMCSVRQKYSNDAKQAARMGAGNTGGKTTPTRSILRQQPHQQQQQQQRSSERLKGSLRWASENVQHTYTLNAPETEDAVRPPSSTRGLRMLGLASASASPKGGNTGTGNNGAVAAAGGGPNSNGKVSPLPASPTGMAATPGGSGGGGSGGNSGNARRRSRTQNVSSGPRSSQGQRLFQALQNASCPPESTAGPSNSRSLSMILFADDGDNDHNDNSNISSGGPTTSDTTTSSNGSRGSGGGGRWEQAEVECLIAAFKEWSSSKEGKDQYVWRYIGDKYRGNGLSDCRTASDLKSKWKAMRRTAGKNRPMRYVKLPEAELEFLRSDASKP